MLGDPRFKQKAMACLSTLKHDFAKSLADPTNHIKFKPRALVVSLVRTVCHVLDLVLIVAFAAWARSIMLVRLYGKRLYWPRLEEPSAQWTGFSRLSFRVLTQLAVVGLSYLQSERTAVALSLTPLQLLPVLSFAATSFALFCLFAH